jgi:DNA polymerase-3 subunit beta
MKATIKKADILPVLAKVQGIAGRKTNLAITTNVLIKTVEKGITISATDLETGFEGTYPAVVDTEGTVSINARKLYEIVRDFPSEDIYLNEIENHWIEIGNQKVEYHIVGMNPDDFPEIPRFEEVDFMEIDSPAFSRMIERSVVISGSGDDRRAHIVGVFVEMLKGEKENVFRLVSTDGSRLSKADYRFDAEGFLPEISGVLIPKKGLIEVSKFLESEGNVKIGFKDNNFIVQKEHETLIVRLLEGEFPEYSDIIAKDKDDSIVLNRQLFLMMLRRMSILSSQDYKGVIFNLSKDTLKITSTNPEIGESKEDMEIGFDGEPITVMFNPKFFMETLSVIEDDNVLIHISSDEKPCVIEGEEDKSYLSVIMPMRI